MFSINTASRLIRLASVLAISSLFNPASAAETAPYPNRPIRIVVPFSAGGGVDATARLLGKYLSEKLGQQAIVENKPGAGGLIAVRHTVSSPADGYTLLLSAAGEIAINPVLNKEAGYDPEKDLVPVAIVVRAPNVLVVNNDVPASNVGELIAYARKHPGELTFSSSGVGTIQHITGAVFNQVAKIDVNHVPYAGAAPATLDVASKRVSMTYASPAAVKPFVQKGQLKMLGVVMSQRYPTLPDLPTIRETAGMESYDVESWFALFAPAGTPDAIVKRLNAEVRQALQTPGIANQLVEMVGTPSFEDADQARVFVRSEIKKYASILNTSNIGRE